MKEFDPSILSQLYTPPRSSHKAQNGKVMLIVGSQLFHAASIWPLTVMSRICDMVFYASTTENNELVRTMKKEFLNGIVVPRERIDDYLKESDCILMGPGMPRENGVEEGDDDTKVLTESLLKKYPHKKWVIDGGSLQVISPDVLPETAIITPHKGEFVKLFGVEVTEETVIAMAKKYNIVVLAKGEVDIIASPNDAVVVHGGNAGMTKGGTGDVLAGLVTALYAKNDSFLSAQAASFINKKAAEQLEEKMGIYFNATDLANEIPSAMKHYL